MKNGGVNHFIVDSPGYGYLGMAKTSGEKLKKMIIKYSKESSRLCKIYVLIDFAKGLTDDDFEFLEMVGTHRMGAEIIFSRIDKVEPKDTMTRAQSLAFQLRKYRDVLNPIFHLASSHSRFGLEGIQSSITQSFQEAPTRKIIRKNNQVYYMLEDKSSVPSQEEQKRYRTLIYDENMKWQVGKEENKSETRKQLESDIRKSNKEEKKE